MKGLYSLGVHSQRHYLRYPVFTFIRHYQSQKRQHMRGCVPTPKLQGNRFPTQTASSVETVRLSFSSARTPLPSFDPYPSPILSPNTRSPQHTLKLISLYSPTHSRATIRLKNHIPEHLLINILFQRPRNPLQRRQCNLLLSSALCK